MNDDLRIIAANIGHIARGCRSNQSHDPVHYQDVLAGALARVSSRLARLEAVAGITRTLPPMTGDGGVFRWDDLRDALAALDAGEEGTLTGPEKLADRGVGSNSGSLSVSSGGEGTT